jgi:hypothetical protein
MPAVAGMTTLFYKFINKKCRHARDGGHPIYFLKRYGNYPIWL